MLAGIRDILIITTPADQDNFKKLLGDGNDFGINLSYAIQQKPNGLAEAFILGESFIGSDNVCLVLGDNIFYGQGFVEKLNIATSKKSGATIFSYLVRNPSSFGVVEFDKNQKVISIEEKPITPKSNYAVTGLYFYDNQVISFSKKLSPSARGELEITDVNRMYMGQKNLFVERLGRGFAWLDTGTHKSLIDAGHFIQTIEQRQGSKVACLEEIAFAKGWISEKVLNKLALQLSNTEYGEYLLELSTEG